MSCSHFRADLQPLLDGQVHGARALALQLHAAGCATCGAAMDSGRRLAILLDKASRHQVMPPADLTAKIQESVRRADRRLAGSRWTGLSTAATILVAMLGTMTAGRALASTSSLAGGPVLPGVRALLGMVGEVLGRFASLFEVINLVPALPGVWQQGSSGSSLLPGLALITTGLLGTAAALYMATTSTTLRHRRRLS